MTLLEIVMTITPWFKQSLGHGFALSPPPQGGKRGEEERRGRGHIQATHTHQNHIDMAQAP